MRLVQHRLYHKPDIRESNPDLPEELCIVIEKMMRRNRMERQKSALELVRELEKLLTIF